MTRAQLSATVARQPAPIFICAPSRTRCACGAKSTTACAYPVKREGKPSTCGRPLCVTCRVLMPVTVCCVAHARVLGAKA